MSHLQLEGQKPQLTCMLLLQGLWRRGVRRFSTLRINDFQDQSGGIGFSGACIIVFHCQTVANARRNVGGLLTLGPVRQVSTAQESCTAQVKPQKCHNVMNVMHFIEDNNQS